MEKNPSPTQLKLVELVTLLLEANRSPIAPNAASIQLRNARISELQALLETATYDEIDAAHAVVREELRKEITA